MSLDIYAAKHGEGGFFWPVMDFEHSEIGTYDDNGEWKHNPDYIPGVVMSMSGVNWVRMCNYVLNIDSSHIETAPLDQILTAIWKALERGPDIYHVRRLFELANICQLGISRGAERLAVL